MGFQGRSSFGESDEELMGPSKQEAIISGTVPGPYEGKKEANTNPHRA